MAWDSSSPASLRSARMNPSPRFRGMKATLGRENRLGKASAFGRTIRDVVAGRENRGGAFLKKRCKFAGPHGFDPVYTKALARREVKSSSANICDLPTAVRPAIFGLPAGTQKPRNTPEPHMVPAPLMKQSGRTAAVRVCLWKPRVRGQTLKYYEFNFDAAPWTLIAHDVLVRVMRLHVRRDGGTRRVFVATLVRRRCNTPTSRLGAVLGV